MTAIEAMAQELVRLSTPVPIVANRKFKLSPRKVANIRRRFAAGGITKTELARKYAVDHKTIARALSGESW